MLQDLKYDYFTYSLVVMTGNLLGNLMLPRWGRVGDRHGNWVVLRWTFLGVSVVPILWTMSGHPAWLLILFLIGGFLWGGLNLCAVNFVFDAAPPAQRTRALAYFNVINGIGIAAGTWAGGILIETLPRFTGAHLWNALFVTSAVLRFAAAWLFPTFVKEVRPIESVGLRRVTYDLVGYRVVQILRWGWAGESDRRAWWKRRGPE
jgi:MFS family permease